MMTQTNNGDLSNYPPYACSCCGVTNGDMFYDWLKGRKPTKQEEDFFQNYVKAWWKKEKELTCRRKEKRQNGRRMKNAGEPMFTLNTQDIHGVATNSRIRRLTPLECERLMGWPDNWTEGVSDTQRYKQCGNGVIAPMVTEVMNALIDEGCLTPTTPAEKEKE